MYEIYRFKLYKADASETLIGTPLEDGLRILSGETDLEVNAAGSLTFKLSPEHAYYGTFQKLSDGIRLYIDGWKSVYFRVIDVAYDFWGNEIITCEDLLAILNDWICLPYYVNLDDDRIDYSIFDGSTGVFSLSLRNIVYIALYTSVANQRPINAGISITSITEPSNTEELAKLSGGGTRILDEMRDIIDRFGGFVYIKALTISTTNGVTITFGFTQADAPGKTCTQTIEYGKNLMDLTIHDNAEDIYTSCIGVGEVAPGVLDDNSWGDAGRVTANDYIGHIYVDASASLVEKYGRRIVYKKFDGLNTPYRVYRASLRYIQQLVAEQVSIEIKAVDLRALDTSQDGFCCGDLVPIKSTPHGINGTFLCSQAHIDLIDLSKTYYTFGAKAKTISSITARR